MPWLARRDRELAIRAARLRAKGIPTRGCVARFPERSSPATRPRESASLPAASREHRRLSERDGDRRGAQRLPRNAEFGVRPARRDIPCARASGNGRVAIREEDMFRDAPPDSALQSLEMAAATRKSERRP